MFKKAVQRGRLSARTQAGSERRGEASSGYPLLFPWQRVQNVEPLSDAITRQTGTRLADFFNILLVLRPGNTMSKWIHVLRRWLSASAPPGAALPGLAERNPSRIPVAVAAYGHSAVVSSGFPARQSLGEHPAEERPRPG